MDRKVIEGLLEGKGVRPTPNRVLVMAELMKASHPLNLSDIEQSLEPMDKASIFRVLELLSEKNLVHEIVDGSRSIKYEFCQGHGHHNLSDQHAHFYCENCKMTFCLEDREIPEIALPEGFMPRQVNYVIKGLCPKCSRLYSGELL